MFFDLRFVRAIHFDLHMVWQTNRNVIRAGPEEATIAAVTILSSAPYAQDNRQSANGNSDDS